MLEQDCLSVNVKRHDFHNYSTEVSGLILSLFSYLNITFVPHQDEDPFTFNSVNSRSALCFKYKF